MQFRQEGNQLKANYMGTIHLQLKLEVVKLENDFAVFPSRQGRWIRPRGNWTEYLGQDHGEKFVTQLDSSSAIYVPSCLLHAYSQESFVEYLLGEGI